MFNQLMQDAAPKAEALKQSTKNITSRVASSQAVKTVSVLGYKAAVNTLGVGLVLVAPMAGRAKNLFGRGLDFMSALAKEQKSTESK